jgi:hypothetical protein
METWKEQTSTTIHVQRTFPSHTPLILKFQNGVITNLSVSSTYLYMFEAVKG